MTILQALEAYYHRLDQQGKIAAPGWSEEKFGFCLVLSLAGAVVDIKDLRDLAGKKPKLRSFRVPQGPKRTSGIQPFFLWDKSAYVLGRTAGDGKRTALEHAAFIELHRQRLADQSDEGLVALRQFLDQWQPDRLESLPGYRPEMLDANIMFQLDGDFDRLHNRPAAKRLVDQTAVEAGPSAFCLVTGEEGPIVGLHPTIKGVDGAQTSGAALVSFNLDAFNSYGKEQGANAPTSALAAFRYGTTLNHLLNRDGHNRVRRSIGDATVVFWADASSADAATAAEDLFGHAYDDEGNDDAATAKIARDLAAIAAGRPLSALRPDLDPGTRFHILGLSPNAARLSVRLWLSDSFDYFIKNLARHDQDLMIEPTPPGWVRPSVGLLLVRTTAPLGEFKNIPPQLAGEVMRAVLTGGRYPQSLLAAVIMRLRAGDPRSKDGKPLSIGWHVAVIRAVLQRDRRAATGDIPVSLKKDYDNPGYQLGRLFAVYELAQQSALGRVKAGLRDRYFGAASATPASIFPLIIRGGQNHLSRLRKDKPGWAALIERELEEIAGRFDPERGHSLPRALSLRDQGEFAIGYYHQRAAKLSNSKGDQVGFDDTPETTDDQGDEE